MADPVDSAVLKEYGFAGLETATYTRGGRKMEIKAARFNDATGAFGAFSYYVKPQMQVEKIGDMGASSNARILFFKGNILVDVSVEHLSAMSGADLRALADALPRPKDDTGKLPALTANLPSQSLVAQHQPVHHWPGSADAAGCSHSRPGDRFQQESGSGDGQVPHLAGRSVSYAGQLSHAANCAESGWMQCKAAALSGGPFYFKRSGPFVVAVNGSIPADEAQSLLASVNYDADVTLLQPNKPKPEDRAGFVFALVMLCIIAVLAALVFGFAFGGIRILANRFFPNKVFSRPESVEIIRLNLK